MATSASKNGLANTWRERIVTQQASGLSIRDWCRRHDCREHSFYWWRARLNLRPGAVAGRARAKQIAFTEVVVRAAAQPLCLRLSGGRELVLPASMEVEQVAKLVRLVEGLS